MPTTICTWLLGLRVGRAELGSTGSRAIVSSSVVVPQNKKIKRTYLGQRKIESSAHTPQNLICKLVAMLLLDLHMDGNLKPISNLSSASS